MCLQNIKHEIKQKKNKIRTTYNPPRNAYELYHPTTGSIPFRGIELSKAYTTLAEKTISRLAAQYEKKLAFLAHGSFSRREMVSLSDIGLIILKPDDFPQDEYEQISSQLKTNLESVGYRHVNISPWSTIQQWIQKGRIETVDIDKVDGSRLIFGNKQLADELWRRIGAIEVDPEVLYSYFFVNMCYRYDRHKRHWIGIKEPNLNYMEGGMKTDVFYIVQCLRYQKPWLNHIYRSLGIRGSVDIVNESLKEWTPQIQDEYLLGPQKADDIQNSANIFLWLRDANQYYSLEHNLLEYDIFTIAAQKIIASEIGMTRKRLMGILEESQKSVSIAANHVEVQIDWAFYRRYRNEKWWSNIWQPIKIEMYKATQQRRKMDQDVIAKLKSSLDDPILRLAYLWFAEDRKELSKYVEEVASRGLLTKDWPYLVGVTRNKNTPFETLERLLPLLQSKFEWRDPTSWIERRLQK